MLIQFTILMVVWITPVSSFLNISLMKTIIIIRQIKAILPTAQPSTLVAGVRVGVVLPLVPREIPIPLCTKQGGQCYADCSKILVSEISVLKKLITYYREPFYVHIKTCAVIGDLPLRNLTCRADRPYCNIDTCSETPDPTNELCKPTTTVKFTCTGAGLFPGKIHFSFKKITYHSQGYLKFVIIFNLIL